MNKAAQSLGKLAAGVPKNYSAAELKRRKARLALARAKRWPKKAAASGEHPTNKQGLCPNAVKA